MADKKSGPGPGRPKTPIDWRKVANMCKIQCTLEEIAGILEMTVDNLERRTESEQGMKFSDFYKQKSAGGKCSLRRRLYKVAHSDEIRGSVSAAIWLSKNYLGMSDKIERVNDDVEPFVIETSKGKIQLGVKRKKKEVLEDD